MPKEFDKSVTEFVRANLPAALPIEKTRKEQAALIGVSDAQLTDVLNGTGKIGKGTLPRFAKALGLTTEELVQRARNELGAPTANRDFGVPTNTLAMASEAAEWLTREDKVPPDEAWLRMRSIRLSNPTTSGFYFAARQPKDSRDGPPDAIAALGRDPGPPTNRKAKR